jgi:hypothetical protein
MRGRMWEVEAQVVCKGKAKGERMPLGELDPEMVWEKEEEVGKVLEKERAKMQLLMESGQFEGGSK